jgi:hypothetical protein
LPVFYVTWRSLWRFQEPATGFYPKPD